MYERDFLSEAGSSINLQRSQVGMDVPARRSGEITVLIKASEETIGNLEKVYDLLVERLTPVMNYNKPRNPEGPEEVRGAETVLGGDLSKNLDRLQQLRSKMERLLSDLEL